MRWLFWAVFFVGVTPLFAAGAEVRGYALAEKEKGIELRLELNKMADANSFLLENPDRVVIDLPGVRWKVPKVGKAQDKVGPITNLRAGYPVPEKLRVVLDTNQKLQIRDSYVQVPEKAGQPHYLIVKMEAAEGVKEVQEVKVVEGVKEVKEVAPSTTPTTPTALAPSTPSKRNFAKKAGEEEKVVKKVEEVKEAPKTTPVTPSTTPTTPTTPTSSTPSTTPTPSNAPVPSPKPERFVIVLDPGHGGVDPGAIGKLGTKEKEVTLRYARHLRDQLKATGRYHVVMTRNSDSYVALRERVKRGQAAEGHLFISLHADSHPEPEMRGLSVYTLSEQASDKEAEALAERENKKDIITGVDLSGQPKEVAEVLIDLAQRDTNNGSARFAEMAVAELGTEAKLVKNSHRFAGFAVLKGVGIPSALVELGYLSNPDEENQLIRGDYQEKLVSALARAIDAYCDQLLEPQTPPQGATP